MDIVRLILRLHAWVYFLRLYVRSGRIGPESTIAYVLMLLYSTVIPVMGTVMVTLALLFEPEFTFRLWFAAMVLMYAMYLAAGVVLHLNGVHVNESTSRS